MAGPKALSVAKEKELVEDYMFGESAPKLVIKYGISERTVYRILAEYNVPRAFKKSGTTKRPTTKKKPKKKLQPCGTDAAYRRHKAAKEYPCQPCMEAHRARVNRDKEAMRKRQNKKEPRTGPPPCGTDAAYQRHRYRGEPVDEACRLAHNEAERERRKKKEKTA